MFSVLCILAIVVVVSEAILYFKTQPPSPSPLGPPAGQPNPTEQPSPSPLSPPAVIVKKGAQEKVLAALAELGLLADEQTSETPIPVSEQSP